MSWNARTVVVVARAVVDVLGALVETVVGTVLEVWGDDFGACVAPQALTTRARRQSHKTFRYIGRVCQPGPSNCYLYATIRSAPHRQTTTGLRVGGLATNPAWNRRGQRPSEFAEQPPSASSHPKASTPPTCLECRSCPGPHTGSPCHSATSGIPRRSACSRRSEIVQ